MENRIEKKLIEFKVQFTKYHYFRAQSELKMLQAVEEERFETAAQERDIIEVFDKKIEEVTFEKNALLQNNH